MNKLVMTLTMFLGLSQQVLSIDFTGQQAWLDAQNKGVSTEIAVRVLTEFPLGSVEKSFQEKCEKDEKCLEVINNFIAAQKAVRADKVKLEKNIQKALNGLYKNYFDNPPILTEVNYEVAPKGLLGRVIANHYSLENRTVLDSLDVHVTKVAAKILVNQRILEDKNDRLASACVHVMVNLLQNQTPENIEAFVELYKYCSKHTA